jgi:hypothetical protein
VEIIVNFDDERFVKIFTRDTVTWKLLGWEGRCVLLMLLRKVDRAGCVDLGSGIEGLALLLDLPEDVTERGFAACLRRSCVTQHDQIAVVPNFVRAQDSRQTDRVRQAESRARRRDSGLVSQNVTDTNEQVTKRDEASQPVTRSHTESHDVTPRLDQTRLDQNKDSLVDSKPSQPELALVPQQAADASKASAKPSKAQIQAQVALGLFGELVAARMSVIAGAEQLQPRPAALAGLKACLGADYTPEQIRHVIKLKVAEVKADPEQAKWFVPTWFRPANVERYLALKEADVARKPRGQAPQAMRPPEPPKSACNPPGGIDFKELREKVESQRTPEGDAKIKAELDRILGRTPC